MLLVYSRFITLWLQAERVKLETASSNLLLCIDEVHKNEYKRNKTKLLIINRQLYRPTQRASILHCVFNNIQIENLPGRNQTSSFYSVNLQTQLSCDYFYFLSVSIVGLGRRGKLFQCKVRLCELRLKFNQWY